MWNSNINIITAIINSLYLIICKPSFENVLNDFKSILFDVSKEPLITTIPMNFETYMSDRQLLDVVINYITIGWVYEEYDICINKKSN